MWPVRLDTECHYLPTEVVPIYLLTFLHAIELLGWQELGQVTGAYSIAWIRSYNCWSSDLAAQRLLQFNPQRHHIPYFSTNKNIYVVLALKEKTIPPYHHLFHLEGP